MGSPARSVVENALLDFKMMMRTQTDQCYHGQELTNQNRPSVIVENTFQYNDGSNG